VNLAGMVDKIKKHPDYHKAGMILCHNGVVRGTSRDGRQVSGLTISVDNSKLKQVIDTHKQTPGIVEILAEIAENRHLAVGDDVMLLVVAGDIRETVIAVLNDTLNAIKNSMPLKQPLPAKQSFFYNLKNTFSSNNLNRQDEDFLCLNSPISTNKDRSGW